MISNIFVHLYLRNFQSLSPMKNQYRERTILCLSAIFCLYAHQCNAQFQDWFIGPTNTSISIRKPPKIVNWIGGNSWQKPDHVDEHKTFTALDIGFPIFTPGEITGFMWYGSRENAVDFHVFRLVDGNTYEVVGTAHAPFSENFVENTLIVNPPIIVEVGDCIGFTWYVKAAFGYTEDVGLTIQAKWGTGGPTAIGEQWTFGEGPIAKQYHYKYSFEYYNTTFTNTTQENGFDATLFVNNTVGEDANKADVSLMKYGCNEYPSTNSDAVFLANSTLRKNTIPHLFEYEIDIDDEKFNNSDLVYYDFNASKGIIMFCTRVITLVNTNDMPVTFRETNFKLWFNLSIEGAGLVLRYADIDDEINDIYGDSYNALEAPVEITACECDDSFNCIDPREYQQNTQVSICLEASSSDVSIQNFALRFAGSKGVEYEAVGFGLDSYEPDDLTTVVSDPNNPGKLKVDAWLVEEIFDGGGGINAVSVTGNAYLLSEQSSMKFTSFDMTLAIENERREGCIEWFMGKVLKLFD